MKSAMSFGRVPVVHCALITLLIVAFSYEYGFCQVSPPRAIAIDLSRLSADDSDHNGWALAFDGRRSIVSSPGVHFHQFDAFTIEAWVRGWEGPILSQGRNDLDGQDHESPSLWMSLGTNPGSRQESCGWITESGADFQIVVGRGDPIGWNHIAVVFDGNMKRLFLNGECVQSCRSSKPGKSGGTERLTIGAISLPNCIYGSGMLRSLRISQAVRYKDAFSPTWVLDNDAATVLLFQPEEGSVSRLRDLSGHDHDGEIQSAKWRRSNKCYSLNLSGFEVGDDDLRHLAPIDSIERLVLWGTNVTDAGLTHIQSLENLRFLGLSHRPITDRGLEQLRNLRKLKELHLWNTRITDRGLDNLEAMTELETLWLGETRVSDAGLKHLSKMVELRKLVLDRTSITGSGLSELDHLTQLRELHLQSTKVSDEQLAHLKLFPALEVLTMGGTSVTDKGLIHLKCLSSLRSLDLNGAYISGVGLQYLRGMESLQELRLVGTFTDNNSLKHIGTFPGLRLLHLSRSRISDEGLVHLEHLKNLRDINLDGNTINGNGLAYLRSSDKLRSLMLWNTQVDDEDLSQVAKFKNLESLNLANTKVTDDGMKYVGRLRWLSTLYLNGTTVTDKGVAELSNLTRLELLGLSRLAEVSDKSIDSMMKFDRLRSLLIDGTSVTKGGEDRLKEAVPTVTTGRPRASTTNCAIRALPEITATLASDLSKNRVLAVGRLAYLAQSSDKARDLLLQLADDHDRSVRLAVVVGFSQVGRQFPEATPKLLELVRDDDSAVGTRAALALARIAMPVDAVVDDLLAMLDDSRLRPRAVGALHALGPLAKAAVPRLLQFVRSSANMSRKERLRLSQMMKAIDPSVTYQGAVVPTRVLIDTSEDGGEWLSTPPNGNALTSRISVDRRLRELLLQEGFDLHELERNTIVDTKELRDSDVVVRPACSRAYTPAETEAFRKAVSEGTRLIMFASASGRDDPLAQAFGLEFEKILGTGHFSKTLDHPLAKLLAHQFLGNGPWVTVAKMPAGAAVLVESRGNRPVFVHFQYGRGDVLLLSSPAAGRPYLLKLPDVLEYLCRTNSDSLSTMLRESQLVDVKVTFNPIDVARFLEESESPEFSRRAGSVRLVTSSTKWETPWCAGDVKAIIPRLTKLLEDENRHVRSTAMHAMILMGPNSPAPVPALLKSLEDDLLRDRAADALGRLGPAASPAVPKILEYCRAGQLSPRVLASIGSQEAILALAELLLETDTPPPTSTGTGRRVRDVRWEAFGALHSLRDKASPAVPALIKLLYDEEDRIRNNAAGSLGTIGSAAKEAIPALKKLASEATERSGIPIVNAIAKIDPAALCDLASDLECESRAVAVRMLATTSPTASFTLPTLTRVLNDPNPEVRSAAAWAIDRITSNPKRTVSTWINLLESDDLKMRTTAIHALGRFGQESKQAIPVLARISGEFQPGESLTGNNMVAKLAFDLLERLQRHERTTNDGDAPWTEFRIPGLPAGDPRRFVTDRRVLCADHWIVTVHEGKLLLWDMRRLTSKTPHSTLANDVWMTKISEDRRWLLCVPRDRNSSLWDLATDDPIKTEKKCPPAEQLVLRSTFDGGQHDLISCQISPQGRWLGTHAVIWDINAAKPLAPNTRPFTFQTVFPYNDRWLVKPSYSGGSGVVLHDLDRNPPATHMLPNEPSRQQQPPAIQFSKSDHWLVMGSNNAVARLFDLTAERPAESVQTLATPNDNWGATFSSDDRWVVLGAGSNDAHLYDLSSDRPAQTMQRLETPTSNWSPWFIPGGRWLVLTVATRTGLPNAFSRNRPGVTAGARNNDNVVHLYDLAASKPSETLRVLPGRPGPSGLRFTPDGRWLMTELDGTTVHVWDLENTEGADLVHHSLQHVLLAKKPDEDRRSPEVYRMMTTREIKDAKLFVESSRLVVDFVAHSMGLGSRVSQRVVWDLAASNPAEAKSFFPLAGELKTHVSPDGRWLLAGSENGPVGLVDLDSDSKRIVPLPGQRAGFPIFSPDVKYLAVCQGLSTIWVYPLIAELDKPRLLTCSGDVGRIVRTEFSEDNTLIVETDKEIHVWNRSKSRN